MAQPNQAWGWSRGYFEPLQGMAAALQLAENRQDLLFDLFFCSSAACWNRAVSPQPQRVSPADCNPCQVPWVSTQQKNLGLEARRCKRELLFLEKLSWPTGTKDMEGSGG